MQVFRCHADRKPIGHRLEVIRSLIFFCKRGGVGRKHSENGVMASEISAVTSGRWPTH